ncbi:hypothetical protein Hanom_Chr15g01337571 [Helianthus anomalus]
MGPVFWVWVSYWVGLRAGVDVFWTRFWAGLSLGWAGVIRGWMVDPWASTSWCYKAARIFSPLCWSLGSVFITYPPFLTYVNCRRHLVVVGLVCVLGINTTLGDIRQDWFGRLSFRSSPNLHHAPKPKPIGCRNRVSQLTCCDLCSFGMGYNMGWVCFNRWYCLYRLLMMIWWSVHLRFNRVMSLDLGPLCGLNTKAAESWWHHVWNEDSPNGQFNLQWFQSTAQHCSCSCIKAASKSYWLHHTGIGYGCKEGVHIWEMFIIMLTFQITDWSWKDESCAQRVLSLGPLLFDFRLLGACIRNDLDLSTFEASWGWG